MSRGVRDHIRHLGSFRFEDLGEQQVKNIDRPVRAFSVMVDDTLGSETDEPNPEPPELAAQELADDAVRLDLAMWQTISGSDQVPEFLLYLERFPEGEFAALARERIATLSQANRHPAAAIPADTAVELAFWDSVRTATIRPCTRPICRNIRKGSSCCWRGRSWRSWRRRSFLALAWRDLASVAMDQVPRSRRSSMEMPVDQIETIAVSGSNRAA